MYYVNVKNIMDQRTQRDVTDVTHTHTYKLCVHLFIL